MAYYHNLITDKSWQLLKKLESSYEFVLIGGWAVFLYTQSLKSKDIDLMIEYDELEKLKNEFEVTKNDRLKKYEAKSGEIEVDIYLPFYSNPGIPAEDIAEATVSVEGFRLPAKEILAVLKGKALENRAETVKGRKDLIDLISLFSLADFEWEKYKTALARYKLEKQGEYVKGILTKTAHMTELGLNVHRMAALKRKILLHLA